MLRLQPTVISLTMAEVKEVERRRLWKKHLEETTGIDKYHWRTPRAEEPNDLEAAVVIRSTLNVADQPTTPGTFEDDKEDVEVISQVQEHNSRAGSPAASAPSINDETRDEQLLPLPSRSCRLETRHHVSTEAEERRSRWEARITRNQARSRTSRIDLPEHGPPNATPEESDAPVANLRDSPNNGRAGSENTSQVHEQGPSSDFSLMINDEPSSWPSTPGPSGASSSHLRAFGFDGASASRTKPHSDDGQEVGSHRPRYRERKVEPSSVGSPSSPSLPRTPSRIQIYNDSLPASSQPQTPQHLSEARHQSQLHTSWTAPPRVSAPHVTAFRTPTMNRVRRRRGLPSPPGLQAPRGFMGLYGGTENIDDSTLFEESSRALGSGDH